MDNNTREWLALAPVRVPAWFPDWQSYLDFCVNRVNFDGLWVEMGTGTGGSAKKIINAMPPGSQLHTFDCFEGLPEEWHHHKQGAFAQEPPKLDPERARIWNGMFEDTLPEFTKEHSENIAFLHVDCDLYGSTKTVFHHLKDQIVPGTIIVFDEIHGYDGSEQHEWLAFIEYVIHNDIYFQFFARYDAPVEHFGARYGHFPGNQGACEILPHPKEKIVPNNRQIIKKIQGE